MAAPHRRETVERDAPVMKDSGAGAHVHVTDSASARSKTASGACVDETSWPEPGQRLVGEQRRGDRADRIDFEPGVGARNGDDEAPFGLFVKLKVVWARAREFGEFAARQERIGLACHRELKSNRHPATTRVSRSMIARA